MSTPLSNEQAAAKLILMFGVIAGVLMFLLALTMMFAALFRPEVDTTGVARMLDTQISLILGGALGWAARASQNVPPAPGGAEGGSGGLPVEPVVPPLPSQGLPEGGSGGLPT
jgi:hypothetical protein